MKWYKLFYLFASLLLVAVGGMFAVIFYLNEDMTRSLFFVCITAGLFLIFTGLFVFFTVRERKIVKRALGAYKLSFSGMIKIDGGSSFEVNAKFYEHGLLLAEQGESYVPFVFEENAVAEVRKFYIDLNIHKLGVVRFLSNKAVKIKAIANLFS